jgi:hypothetical protein
MKRKSKISRCQDTGSIKYSRKHLSVEFYRFESGKRYLLSIGDKIAKSRTYASINRDDLVELLETVLREAN